MQEGWYSGHALYRCATTQTASPMQTNKSPSLLSGVAPQWSTQYQKITATYRLLQYVRYSSW